MDVNKLKKIVGSVWFVPGISIFLSALFVWFAGPYFAVAGYYPLASISSRIIVIISILLIYFFMQLIKYHQKMKKQTLSISRQYPLRFIAKKRKFMVGHTQDLIWTIFRSLRSLLRKQRDKHLFTTGRMKKELFTTQSSTSSEPQQFLRIRIVFI